MTIKYKAMFGFSRFSIDAVEIMRETEKCVWVPSIWNRRGAEKQAKHSDNHSYCDTWAQAHTLLTAKAEERLQSARYAFEKAQGLAAHAHGMKDPTK